MESERLRNSLLAALSHDLRTPLTALVGLSESLALRAAAGAAQLAMAQALHDEAVRMSTLVANLLDMARIESGKSASTCSGMPLKKSSAAHCAPAARAAAATRQPPGARPATGALRRRADRTRAVQPARKCGKIHAAGPRIVIAAQPLGAWLHVTVRDDGPGLPPGNEEAMFEKFTRGERESAMPGVGLGLAICRAIVEAMAARSGAGTRRGGAASCLHCRSHAARAAGLELTRTTPDA